MTDIHPDRLYLTSTGRLARDLTRRFRLQCLRDGKEGWEPLRALTLNGWLDRTCSELWPEEIPAPDLYRLSLWKELARRIEPPSPLTADPDLCAILDETFGVMVRHTLDPASGFPSTPLVEWRREISAAFRKSLEAAGLFHPSSLPVLLRRAIIDGKMILPDRIALAGFESPAPVECELFATLEKYCDVTYITPSPREPERIEALALPSPEQEVIFLVHRLVQDARTIPLHRIGVIVPDMDRYAKELERKIRDVMGTLGPRGSSWFNMTKGVPLLETRLMQAALLPLRFVIEGEPRELLLSLFLSPYYGYWQGIRHRIARADIVWRKRSVDSDLDNLLRVLKAEDHDMFAFMPSGGLEYLSVFCRRTRISEKKKGGFWAAQLRDLWNHLGFPVGADEKDTVDRRGLDEIMKEIDRHLSETWMDGYEFSAWLAHLASRKMVQVGAAEDAGIQIMGVIESRGLAFDKLYVLGMDDHSLPEPARPLPFLDSTERALVQGGTAESQYEFARRSFDHLMRIAPDITLLRAEQEDLKPLAPSPFWPEDEEKRSIDIWNTPDHSWLRAEWLRRAYEGLQEAPFDLQEDEVSSRFCLPETVSVSRLQTAVTCPYRFFVEAILNMEPLEEIEPDTSPREKGTRIHRALALFTHRAREGEIDLSSDEARALLTVCVDEALQNVALKPQWQVERRRWIGGTGGAEKGGILIEWLDREQKRWLEGWRCVAEEAPFDGLAVAGLPFVLRGRIDRVDFSNDEGLLLWDYKTGTPSSAADIVKRLKDSQLVIYLMALAEGRIPGLETYTGQDVSYSAGYIRLRSAGDIGISPVKGIETSLEEWRNALTRLGAILGSGDFRPEPFPVSNEPRRELACKTCPFITLCRVGVLGPQWTDTEEETDEAAE